MKKRVKIAGCGGLLALAVIAGAAGGAGAQGHVQAKTQTPAQAHTAPEAKAQTEMNPAAKDPVFVRARQAEEAGRLTEAEKLAGDKVQALEDTDPDSAELVPFLNLFAEICVKKKELPEAHAAYQEGLEIDEELHGPADAVCIHDMLNLAATAGANTAEAEQITLQALDLAQRNPHLTPDTFVEVLSRLAALYQAQQRWEEAAGYAGQGMEICKATRPAPAGCAALGQMLPAIRRQSGLQGNAGGPGGNQGKDRRSPGEDDEGP